MPEPIERQVLFDPSKGGPVDTPVYLREQLRPGDGIHGPALITEDQTTTVVTSNYHAIIDARDHIVMTRQEESRDE